MDWEQLAGRRLNEEIQQHLQDRYDDLTSQNVPADAARRLVLDEVERRERDDLRIDPHPASQPLPIGSAARGSLLAGLGHDLRYGARLAVKDRGSATIIVLTLALAIAANGVVFGFADLLLFRPLPVANAGRMAAFFSSDAKQSRDRRRLSIPEYLDVKSRATSFLDIAGMTLKQMSLTGTGEARAVNVQLATPNLHQMWGLGAAAGRALRPDDGLGDRRDVAVLSHRFWSSQLAADPTVVGRTIGLNGSKFTIVGVLAPAVEIGNLTTIDVWLPLDATQAARRDDRVLATWGLLKPGVTVAAASAELAAIGERLGQEHPLTDGGRRMFAMSLRDSIAGGDTWLVLAFLEIIVFLVLVVACANVATVMLARASARRREVAVRIAIGASRGRLLRQLGVEGLVLGLLSGAAGLLFTQLGLVAFKAYSVEVFFQGLVINRNMLAFTLGLSIIAPVLFAVLPAMQMARPDLNEDLKDGGRDARPSARGNRSRSVLVVAQVAFALAALLVSGLIVRTIVAMKRAPLGFSPDGVLTLRVRLDPPKYTDAAQRLRMVESALDRLGRLPGVASASAMAALPVIEGEPSRRFTIAGRPTPEPADLPWAVEATTIGDYTATLDLRVLEGRGWREQDRAGQWGVAVVNREAVRRYWPGRSPVGEHIAPIDSSGAIAGQPLEIVGVVDDVVGTDVDEPPPPRMYRPMAARPPESIAVAVRSTGEAGSIAPAVRDTLRDMDPDLAVSQVQSLRTQIRESLRETELLVALFSVFAAIGLAVAVAGIYGVTTFAVRQRRHEIGVRIALGATGASVVRLVVWRSARLVLAGAAVGLGLGWGLAKAMRTLLTNGVGATDPLTYSMVLLLLALVTLVACYLPARKVTRVDPLDALRVE